MRHARPQLLFRRVYHSVCPHVLLAKATTILSRCTLVLERRGMNLFTLTDHDSIEGAEKLRGHPGFFLSEELTCRMPSGTEVHIGVYDFHERQHVQLQQRRNDLVSLLMYLSERRIFFSINHVFSSLTGRRDREDFAWFQEYFPAVETRNSHMLEETNCPRRPPCPTVEQNRGRRKRRACHAIGRYGLHGSSGRARQGRILRGFAQRRRPGPRRIRQLPEIDHRRAVHRGRADARKTLDNRSLAPRHADPGDHAVQLLRRASLQPPLGRRTSRSIEIAPASPLDHRSASCATNGNGRVGMTVGRAVWNQINSNDHRLMRRVHRWRAPRWFRILMILATRGGDGWLWYALGAILFFYGGSHRFAAIGAAGSASVAGILIFRALKKTSRRKRPCEIEPHCWSSILPPGQILVPVRPFHHRVRGRAFDRTLLSRPDGLSAHCCVPDCEFSNHPRHAFPQRRDRRIRDRSRPRNHCLPHFCAALESSS